MLPRAVAARRSNDIEAPDDTVSFLVRSVQSSAGNLSGPYISTYPRASAMMEISSAKFMGVGE